MEIFRQHGVAGSVTEVWAPLGAFGKVRFKTSPYPTVCSSPTRTPESDPDIVPLARQLRDKYEESKRGHEMAITEKGNALSTCKDSRP